VSRFIAATCPRSHSGRRFGAARTQRSARERAPRAFALPHLRGPSATRPGRSKPREAAGRASDPSRAPRRVGEGAPEPVVVTVGEVDDRPVANHVLTLVLRSVHRISASPDLLREARNAVSPRGKARKESRPSPMRAGCSGETIAQWVCCLRSWSRCSSRSLRRRLARTVIAPCNGALERSCYRRQPSIEGLRGTCVPCACIFSARPLVLRSRNR
jgi:hypothetical protein